MIVCSKCGKPARDGIPLRHENGVATCAKCEPKLPEGPARQTVVVDKDLTAVSTSYSESLDEVKAEEPSPLLEALEDAALEPEPKPRWWEKRSS